MTAFDKLIAADLASLAIDNRRGPGSSDDVLDAIARSKANAIRRDPTAIELTQLFVQRTARLVTGTVALLCALGPLCWMYGIGIARDGSGWPISDGWAWPLLDSDTSTIVVRTALLIAVTYAITARIARRWIERTPGEAARLAHKIERPARVLWTAGPLLLALVFGTIAWFVGRERWTAILMDPVDHLGAVSIALAASATMSLARGLLPRRGPLVQATDTALLVPARIHADRMARLAGGAVAGLSAIVGVIALHRPFPVAPFFIARRWTDTPLSLREVIDQALYWWAHDWSRLAATTIIAVLIARQIARSIAARQIPAASGRMEGWSLGIGAGGVAALGALLGISSMAVGDELYVLYYPHGPRLAHVTDLALQIMTPMVLLIFVVGVALGRAAACTRKPRLVRILMSRRGFEAAVAFTLVSVVMAEAVDFGFGPSSREAAFLVPPAGLQLGLSIFMSLSMLALCLSDVLRRRQREQR